MYCQIVISIYIIDELNDRSRAMEEIFKQGKMEVINEDTQIP